MMHDHPLLGPFENVLKRIALYRSDARTFYHEVVLGQFACPDCGGGLLDTAASRAQCRECGHVLDPSLVFQRSQCCGAPLRWARQHYVCSSCRTVVPSRFLFDERVFDATYFRERMAEFRERRRREREELSRLMAREQSGVLQLADMPSTDIVDELFTELDSFVRMPDASFDAYRDIDTYSLDAYRDTLRRALAGCMRRFDAFPSLHTNLRTDRARRFVTLVYMEHDHEIVLHQRAEDILVIPRWP